MSSHTDLNAQKSEQALNPVYVLAWLLCAVFYFYQYAIRATPGIMQGILTENWGHNPLGIMVPLYYVAYAGMALIAGFLLDRYGAHKTIPAGIALVTIGSLFFARGYEWLAITGFTLQAVGSIFAFLGASYIAARYLPQRMLAIFVGFTECLGMAGAAFGSKLVSIFLDPAGAFHVQWQKIWIAFAIIGAILTVSTFIVMPHGKKDQEEEQRQKLDFSSLIQPFRLIFSNPQSWLAGVIGGLLFAPTTIGILAWGASFFSKGEHISIAEAATLVSMVPLGWVIGCPLIGYISDKIGHRRPVLIGGSSLLLLSYISLLYLPTAILPAYMPPLLMGIASGAAMLPFSVMKEVNPPEVKGTAAGIMNFLVFLTSSLMSPVITGLIGSHNQNLTLADFHRGFMPLIVGIALAIFLSFFLRETGWKHSQK